MAAVRRFLQRDQPFLHTSVYWASVSLAVGGVTDDPQATVATALREAPGSHELCSLLASPEGQAALTALGFLEFSAPEFRVLFALLPTAAKLVCAERQRAFGLGALTLGFGLILLALAGGKKAN
jgi:hypothetical protein